MSNDKIYTGRITGKIVFSAWIKNTSPILVGKGEGELSDTEVMLWEDKTPYIPASSFAGALRHFFEDCNAGTDNENFEKFWGSDDSKKEKTWQSHLSLDDLRCPGNTNITLRDGVRIDYATGVAQAGGKYDYQLVEPDAVFMLKGEVTIRNGMDDMYFKKMVATIKAIIEDDDFRIGALTGFGFGKLSLSSWEAFEFNFREQNEEPGKRWFQYLQGTKNGLTHLTTTPNHVLIKPGKFHISATFKIKSALIIGAYNTDKNLPDKTHLTSNGTAVITAKSVKGAIRHRAVKILNTVGIYPEELLNNLLGWVEDEGNGNKAQKSRLRIEEAALNGIKSITQNRIRIDRFTGGVISGGLFNSAPVWRTGIDNFTLQFTIRNYKKTEATLLLHLLKDLWTDDLPIGGEKNIGRGILMGQEAVIKWNDKIATIKRNGDSRTELTGAEALADEFNQAL